MSASQGQISDNVPTATATQANLHSVGNMSAGRPRRSARPPRCHRSSTGPMQIRLTRMPSATLWVG